MILTAGISSNSTKCLLAVVPSPFWPLTPYSFVEFELLPLHYSMVSTALARAKTVTHSKQLLESSYQLRMTCKTKKSCRFAGQTEGERTAKMPVQRTLLDFVSFRRGRFIWICGMCRIIHTARGLSSPDRTQWPNIDWTRAGSFTNTRLSKGTACLKITSCR